MFAGLTTIIISCQQKCKRGNEENIVDFSNAHLMPVGGFYEKTFLNDYYSKVHNVLFNGLDDRPVIRFQVFPSFEPESVLDIEHDMKNDKFYINYHICDKIIWENMDNLDKIIVNKFRVEIEKESVDLIQSLFEHAIDRVRYPKINKNNEKSYLTDGVKYQFTIGWEGHSLRSGETHSPSRRSKMDRLVNIGNYLIRLSKSGDGILKVENDFEKEINILIKELK